MSKKNELKSCPHCGGTELRIFSQFNDETKHSTNFYIVCLNCRMRGPESFSSLSAIKTWNDLPRILKWKSEPPTISGWYYTRRNRPGKPLRIMYVKRVKKYDHRIKKWRYFMVMAKTKSEDGYIIDDLNQPDRIWAGPIQEPIKISKQKNVDVSEEK